MLMGLLTGWFGSSSGSSDRGNDTDNIFPTDIPEDNGTDAPDYSPKGPPGETPSEPANLRSGIGPPPSPGINIAMTTRLPRTSSIAFTVSIETVRSEIPADPPTGLRLEVRLFRKAG